jgi:hypothetical protein
MNSLETTRNLAGDSAASGSPQRISNCARCGMSLRLQPPTNDAPALPWLCNGCGSVYFASRPMCPGTAETGGCRLQAYDKVLTVLISHLDVEADSMSKLQAEAFAKRSASQTVVGAELRKRRRHSLVTPVIAVPLGPDFRVTGRPTRMFTVDVSQSGIRLVHTKAINAPMLALDFTNGDAETVSVILTVKRARGVGSAFEIAGPLLCRIVRTP